MTLKKHSLFFKKIWLCFYKFKNYFEIVHLSKKDFSNNIYVKTLGKNGGVFKYIYKMGEVYDKTKLVSPVYLINKIQSLR